MYEKQGTRWVETSARKVGSVARKRGRRGEGHSGKPDLSQSLSRGTVGRPAMGEGRRETEVKAKVYTSIAITLCYVFALSYNSSSL